jgi:RimJ/RimL family protein N-acetyltransferase
VLPTWRQTLARQVQRILWIYLRNNFVIGNMGALTKTEAGIKCTFVPITFDNSVRVQEFREQRRVDEYREKLGNREIGFFAECDGRMVGSIWATINSARVRSVVRMYMPLMPNDALIHDIVTGERLRGKGVGPFMVGRMASTLLNECGVGKIIIDVSFRNRASLRMMEKVGLQVQEQVFYVSLFSNLAFQKTLKTTSAQAS